MKQIREKQLLSGEKNMMKEGRKEKGQMWAKEGVGDRVKKVRKDREEEKEEKRGGKGERGEKCEGGGGER